MRKLNRILMVLVMLIVTIPVMGAMSTTKVRQNTRFLTDRMAYELNLTQNQYDDVYEVNYDFINNVRYIMDDVSRGDYYAIDRYYDFLDVRNDDLSWILSSSQYSRFINKEYFYRPIYISNSRWNFRIYDVYTNINFFYFKKPYHYSTYNGSHYRTHFNNNSFYKSRWDRRYNFRERYNNNIVIRNDKRFDYYVNHDFGVPARPNNDRRPEVAPRPDNNRRPSVAPRPDNNRRPEVAPRPNNDRRPEVAPRPDNNRNPEVSRPSATPSNSSRPSRVENRRNVNVRSTEDKKPSSTVNNVNKQTVSISQKSKVSSSTSSKDNSSKERGDSARRR